MKEFSLSDLNRRPGELADAALASPIMLRKHGRFQLVMMSAEHYEKLVGATLASPPAAPPTPPRKSLLAGLRSGQEENVD